jgi:P27 family predicted phage terminase small subunit
MIRAPGHLKPSTRKWWRAVVEEYQLDATGLQILTSAAELRDRAEDARELVEAEGPIALDRFGQAKENPAAKLERDSKIAFARLMRELGLSADEVGDFRPPRIEG